MDPDLLLILPTALIIIVSLGGFALTGWRMWLRRPRGSDLDDLSELARQQVRSIVREEMSVLLEARDGELDELSERIEFAERLLVRARSLEGQLEREPTPV